MRADRAVEPTRSENITVTWRRSARSSGVQRRAVATVDSATNKATALIGEGRGVAMRAGSARKCSVTVVKVTRVLLGVRRSGDHHHGRKQCKHGPALLRPHRRASIYGYDINERYPTLVASPSYPMVGAPRGLATVLVFVEATAPFGMLRRCGVGRVG